MEQIVWRAERRKVSELIHWDKNPRKIADKDFEKLKERIKARGFHDVIKIDTDNVILSGNMRKDALQALGVEEVNVLVPSRALITEERVVIALESNRNDGEDDAEKLMELGVGNLFEAGYDEAELSGLLDHLDTEDDGFDEKKAIEEAKKQSSVKEGDIYQLGDHVLMCGDSTNIRDVAKLMHGGYARMIYCDPPYNIGLDYSKGIGTAGKYQGVSEADLDDSKTNEGYSTFVEATIRNAVAHAEKDAHVFYWCDERYIWVFQTLFEACGVANKRVCLWIKNNQNQTPQVAFNKAYEPCVYGTIGRPYLNPGLRNLNEILDKEVGAGNEVHEDIMDIFTLWLTKRVNATEYEHPTQKPTELHEKPLKRCTAPGDVVLDLFGGSGSTLMACEQLKRKSRLMEMNPIFAQVILNRWEAYTGKKAEKIV